MFQRIIIATDLSPLSQGLVECLEQLKHLGTKECLLLQCLSAQETASIALSTTATLLEKTLQQQKNLLEGYGFAVETRILPGQIKSEVNQIAAKEGYSLVIAGAQKQSAASEVFFKGLPYDLALHARVPVFLVRLAPEDQKMVCPAPFAQASGTSLLFPTDFSKNADLAFQYLLDLAPENITKVTLLHVQNPKQAHGPVAKPDEDLPSSDESKLAAMKVKLKEKGLKVEVLITSGEPGRTIVQVAQEQKTHIILMGSQGRGFVREMLLGSVSRHVARSADTSVLLIPWKSEKKRVEV